LVATGDLLKVYNDIRALLRDQHNKHTSDVARQLTRVAHHVNIPFFAPLIGKVTSFALNKLAGELSRSRKPDFPRACTGTFRRSMGLPCGHELKRLFEVDAPLQPGLIHQHWFYLPNVTSPSTTAIRVPLLLNPTAPEPSEAIGATISQPEPADLPTVDELLDIRSASSSRRDSSVDFAGEAGECTTAEAHRVPAPIPPEQTPILEPEEAQGRGRPGRSTRRNPSHFETVGARVRRRRAREAV
jgi:hypothetical protein